VGAFFNVGSILAAAKVIIDLLPEGVSLSSSFDFGDGVEFQIVTGAGLAAEVLCLSRGLWCAC